ncbi:hypothetical protein [Methylovirgula sp. HY1]|uniref:hypothetical protein n=1 Tax=Methylovirgula sp. HY1 TaxID=2822761 RepID=UPI001C5B84EC|nr:hypothetical protein [Methylovirgula sp. HY1]
MEFATDKAIFGDARPSWVEFVEVLEAGPGTGCCPPPEVSYKHDYSDDDFGEDAEGDDEEDEPFPEWPEATASESLSTAFTFAAGIERPTFGRRMALIFFGGDVSEKRFADANERIRRALGYTAKGVWHGADCIAYCFVDSRTPEQIAHGLERVKNAEIEDFLIVEALSVPLRNPTVSPLDTWVTSEFRHSASAGRRSSVR